MRDLRPNRRLIAGAPAAAAGPHVGPGPLELDPSDWPVEKTDAVEEIVKDLRERAIEAIVHPDGFSFETLRPLRHRVLMDRERFAAVVESEELAQSSADFLISLDFRLDEVGRRTICHVSFTLWSATPWSAHHRPPDLGYSSNDVTTKLPWRTLRDTFVQARDLAAAFIDRYFTTANLRVFGRPYRAPTFWTVVPALPECTPASLLDEEGELREPDFAEMLLGGSTSRARLVAMSVIDRDMLAFRRFVPNVPRLEDSPTYLFLPTSSRRLRRTNASLPRQATGPDVEEADLARWAEHEDDVRRIITTITDLEAFVASKLWDIETDLDIWDTHLSGYVNAADRAARIWDGLASHLVTSRGGALAEVHRSIEMIHQTLLQGVSDIDRIATLTAERAGQLGRLGEEIDQRYAEALFESTCPGRMPVGDSYTATGHFEVVSRRATEMAEKASRASQNYRDLLQAIGHAFDERRVRETDAVQRIGAGLAVALAGIGGVTVLDALFDAKFRPEGTPWWYWIPIAVAALALGAVGTSTAVRVARIGRLGSRTFRAVYRDLWQFLRLTTTDRLNRVRALIEAPAPRHPTSGFVALVLETNDHDTRRSILESVPPLLAELCAAFWLEVDQGSHADPDLVRARLEHELVVLPTDDPSRNAIELMSLSFLLDEKDRLRTSLWKEYDAQLAHSFCDLWDRIDPLPGDERIVREHAPIDEGVEYATERPGIVDLSTALRGSAPTVIVTGGPKRSSSFWSRARRTERDLRRRDRRQLANMTEKWTLRTLLVTERPREMYWYSLPQLTLLYRASFALLDDRRRLRDQRVLSYTDMRFVLGQFPRHGLRSEQIEALDRWLDIQVADIGPPPRDSLVPVDACRASTLYARIQEAKIHAGLGGHMIGAERRGDVSRQEIVESVTRTIADHEEASQRSKREA